MKWLGGLLLLLLLLGGGSFLGLQVYLRTPMVVAAAVVDIPQGSSVTRIVAQLAQAGVIRFPQLFRWYVRLQQADRRVQIGEYAFDGPVTPRQVLTKLVSGDFITYELRIPEGWTMRQIAGYVAGQPFSRTRPDYAEQFLIDCHDSQRIAALGIAASSLEGYLFPSTYRIPRPRTPAAVVDMLTATFVRQWDAELQAGAAAVGMTMAQVVTLASIIEKETGAAAERLLVSAVFHNRLKKGMLLQTDPTVIYGLPPNFDGNIRRADLANPHPYNTYVHPGLPPGPIANPGRASLLAAIHPAAVDYLFFVAKGDGSGTHVFTTNYTDHVNAVNQYQR